MTMITRDFPPLAKQWYHHGHLANTGPYTASLTGILECVLGPEAKWRSWEIRDAAYLERLSPLLALGPGVWH